MVHKQNLTTRPILFSSLVKPALVGGGIGLFVISIFLLGVIKNDHPEWGKLWMIRPLIIVPIAGAGGGLFFYFMDYVLGYQGGWAKIVAVVAGLIGFLIALWLGTVLGLNGTMWH